MTSNAFSLILLVFLLGCQREKKITREMIFLPSSQTQLLSNLSPQESSPPVYPWTLRELPIPPITPEHFRCKGKGFQTVREVSRDEKNTLRLIDCVGGSVHSLPLKENQEYVYPPLVSILNYLQRSFETKVIITTGHRCPVHNRFCDASSYNWNSKHMIGGEVDFYLEGMEDKPLKIIEKIQEYYQAYPPEMRIFKRFEAEKLNISTDGWYNEEIFIKLYKSHEGRDIDNLHPFPYISIQMRSFNGERVTFDQKIADNYLRD